MFDCYYKFSSTCLIDKSLVIPVTLQVTTHNLTFIRRIAYTIKLQGFLNSFFSMKKNIKSLVIILESSHGKKSRKRKILL